MEYFDKIKNLILEEFNDALVEVNDLTGNHSRDHLGVQVISDDFNGKPLIQQHQMIMDILKSKLLSEEIHAVKIKTMTKEKAKEKGII
jgi:stress-induced morphogen